MQRLQQVSSSKRMPVTRSEGCDREESSHCFLITSDLPILLSITVSSVVMPVLMMPATVTMKKKSTRGDR